MIVTVGIIALNEERNIGNVLRDLLDQTYDKSKIELILVDAISEDKTKSIMQEFLEENLSIFFDIKIMDNYKKNQPSGWNVVIDNSVGDIMIRIDAHSRVPKDFVEKNVEVIESGEKVCGGRIVKVIESNTLRDRYLLMAENSIFGSSPAKYRRSNKREYVKSVAQTCYKRDVLNSIKHFDDRLSRSEDNDFHYRIRERGYKICMSNEIKSDYLMRSSLSAMIKQKYKNAYWIGVTSIGKTPRMFSLYHFAPFLFLLMLIVSLVLLVVGVVVRRLLPMIYPFCTLVGIYLFVDIVLAIKSAIDYKQFSAIFVLPYIFPLLHFAYAFGLLFGLLDFKAIIKIQRESRGY